MINPDFEFLITKIEKDIIVHNFSYKSINTRLYLIKEKLNSIRFKGRFILDNLTYSSFEKNRFISVYFDGEHFKSFTTEKVQPSFIKKANDVYRNNIDYLKNSILSKFQIQQLLNNYNFINCHDVYEYKDFLDNNDFFVTHNYNKIIYNTFLNYLEYQTCSDTPLDDLDNVFYLTFDSLYFDDNNNANNNIVDMLMYFQLDKREYFSRQLNQNINLAEWKHFLIPVIKKEILKHY